MLTFQQIIARLNAFWEKQGCIIMQPYDMEKGAGTFHPATFLGAIGPEPTSIAYAEPSRRPTDGRYGENPNRVSKFYQYQVMIKPSPLNIQALYLESLKALGLDLTKHDIRFVHDDWESPTLGAWGLGWEVWCDGMEITQFTYFQQVGGLKCDPVSVELTYGLERLAMYLQNVDSMFDLKWNATTTYRDLFYESEKEFSKYNFEVANVTLLFQHFKDYSQEVHKLLDHNLPLCAYDYVMKASHIFNTLDARNVISVMERQTYIHDLRHLACLVAKAYLKMREDLSFPLLKPQKKEKSIKLPSLPKAKTPQDFVLEIGTEQIPAHYLKRTILDLKKEIEALLKTGEIAHGDIHTFATPTRLSIQIQNLAAFSTPSTIEKKGPPLLRAYDTHSNPTAAANGFFASLGLKTPLLVDIESKKYKHVFIKKIKDIDYLFVVFTPKKQATCQILSNALKQLILALPFPKTMRWNAFNFAFARPIQSLLALFGKEVVPFRIGNVASSKKSFSIPIASAKNYASILLKHGIVADVEKRTQMIENLLEKACQKFKAKCFEKEKILDEVVFLTEAPHLVIGSFDKAFLKLPKELLASEMLVHQRVFPLQKGQKLIHHFAFISNQKPSSLIQKGNEKVIQARLKDGQFLFEQDQKYPFLSFNEKLKSMTYQKELGSMFDKVTRLKKHIQSVHPLLNIANKQTCLKVSDYLKADLATELVKEFPELQGIVGTYLAKELKQDAIAIKEHYMPLFEMAPLPKSPCGIFFALLDKLDNLLAFFALGKKPTSSSDPFALRRQAIGICRILNDQKCFFSLKDALLAMQLNLNLKANPVDEICSYLLERQKMLAIQQGVSKEIVDATFANDQIDLFDFWQRIHSLHTFRGSKNFLSLVEVFKRLKGQIKDFKIQPFSKKLLKEVQEKNLFNVFENIENAIKKSLEKKEYTKVLQKIAEIQKPLQELFDHVLILSKDNTLKQNRIGLLQKIFTLCFQIFDISELRN